MTAKESPAAPQTSILREALETIRDNIERNDHDYNYSIAVDALAAPALPVTILTDERIDEIIAKTWSHSFSMKQHLHAVARAVASGASLEPTDLSKRLRAGIEANGVVSQADTLAAADEIERYYGGMLAWKQTAEKKDRDWNAERMARVDDRIAAKSASLELQQEHVSASPDSVEHMRPFGAPAGQQESTPISCSKCHGTRAIYSGPVGDPPAECGACMADGGPGYSDRLADRIFNLPCNWKGDERLSSAVLMGHTMACEQAYILAKAHEKALPPGTGGDTKPSTATPSVGAVPTADRNAELDAAIFEVIRQNQANRIYISLNQAIKKLADVYAAPVTATPPADQNVQHDSDCSTNNRGVPSLLGPCDCSVSATPPATAEQSSDTYIPWGYANETEWLRQQLKDAKACIKAHQAVLADRDATIAGIAQPVAPVAATPDLTTMDCPTCNGVGMVGGHTGQTPESYEEHTAGCDDCDGQGKIIVSKSDLAAPVAVSEAARDVLAERQRQIEQEGWTPEGDDRYFDGDMARAAAAYAISSTPGDGKEEGISLWPARWSSAFYKPADPRRSLVKAAALILADIERIDRATPTGQSNQTKEQK